MVKPYLRRLRALSFGVIILCLAVSCDPLEPSSGIGATSGQEGQPLILVDLCAGSIIREVRVVISNDIVVGNEDDEVLWSLRPKSSVRSARIPYGFPPTGWQQISTPKALSPDREVEALVVLPGDTQFVSFTPKDLTAGTITSDGRELTTHEYVIGAQEACQS